MSELLLIFIVIGAVAIAMIFILLAELFGSRLKRAKFGVSPYRGIFGEVETVAPDEKGLSPTPVGAPSLSPGGTFGAKKGKNQSSTFMDDDYIVDILARLKLAAEEGDIIRFHDRTSDEERE